MNRKIPMHAFFLIILSLLCVQVSYAQKKGKKKETSPKKEVVIDTIRVNVLRSAPVAPFVDTLFYVYGDIGAVKVEQRANAINENIRELEEDPFFEPDSLHVGIDEGRFLIVYLNKTIMGVDEQQSQQLNRTKEDLAKEYRQIIANAIEQEKEQKSWKVILKQVLLSIVILGITFFCLKYLLVFFNKLARFVGRQHHKTIKKIYTVIDADKQIAFALWCLKLIRFIAVIFVIYFCLFTFFRLFPETMWISNTLIDYILSPLKKAFKAIKNFIPNLFSIIVIILIFRYLAKIVKTLAEKIQDGSLTLRGFYPDWALPTYNIIKGILFVFMFILIYGHLPLHDSPVFQGVSVFMGILFSLGSTSVISNVVSGLVITYMRPFKVGDRIKMGEFLGNVVEKTPLVTRIKTPKNELITIPNANIMTAQTVNYTNSANEYGLILYSTVTMGYEVPWRKVHELLLEAGMNTPNVLHDPKPFVLQIALDDFYVEYQINVYTKNANEMANIYSDLYKNVQDVFARENIELLSPHYRAQRDGSEITVPQKDNSSERFKVSPFNLRVKIENDENSKS